MAGESPIKWLTRHADILFLGSFVSAGLWCVVWVVGFCLLTYFSGRLDYPTGTTALFLSLTVLLGHLPKLVSMFLGTDTDFQDFRDCISDHSLSKVPWPRFILAGTLIILLVRFVIPAHMGVTLEGSKMNILQEGIDPMDIGRFFRFTGLNWQICGMLFLIQAVFSYPKGKVKVVSETGKKLPGAA